MTSKKKKHLKICRIACVQGAKLVQINMEALRKAIKQKEGAIKEDSLASKHFLVACCAHHAGAEKNVSVGLIMSGYTESIFYGLSLAKTSEIMLKMAIFYRRVIFKAQ